MQTEMVHNLSYINGDLQEFMSYLNTYYIAKRQGAVIATVNPEIGYAAAKDKGFHNVISSADFVLPDGIGVVLMSRLTHHPLKSRIAGFDVFISLLNLANQQSKKIFLYGAKKEVLDAVLKRIGTEFPQIEVVGSSDGYAADKRFVAKQISRAKPDIVFVALGYPHQEKFIYEYKHLFPQAVAIGLGGSFDVFSGTVKRAPRWMIKTNTEWLYRLIKNPWRWKRMLNIPKYAFTVLRENKIQKGFYSEQAKDQTKQL
ncbi:WecB/TagA/CpsF family glycosyltransferase [Bacillus atrophaeus]|uniref:WecB/TagA/CpsF family glycosyltransferase n=1 Tax=Bacillus atrophaeus TaxID=1452 RepID=UPI00227F09B1|nr:WecB/TagA/CpsF family glycosyltransferase [Bacillus atrophaeus]MCY8908335.1 WecB/TagA/CpsF family glycosyltransferase [Bacillus atrophaeus]MEC0837017.1 WecB/TagA/CpsF family glycosyltransferase [Bacillus atrophaeus]MEC0844348.1 WecB/TagA/CpsF family glycosyltransferase [Bacillus atrophaeus]MEC0849310.1 WecB/TagA/CpsF family glycosyltransferase [Bacillus atrophaeus]MEC0864136.1 WecB/TagA/CpsF family glycosyltransferase [Bacillus atrophaeus]